MKCAKKQNTLVSGLQKGVPGFFFAKKHFLLGGGWRTGYHPKVGKALNSSEKLPPAEGNNQEKKEAESKEEKDCAGDPSKTRREKDEHILFGSMISSNTLKSTKN